MFVPLQTNSNVRLIYFLFNIREGGIISYILKKLMVITRQEVQLVSVRKVGFEVILPQSIYSFLHLMVPSSEKFTFLFPFLFCILKIKRILTICVSHSSAVELNVIIHEKNEYRMNIVSTLKSWLRLVFYVLFYQGFQMYLDNVNERYLGKR